MSNRFIPSNTTLYDFVYYSVYRKHHYGSKPLDNPPTVEIKEYKNITVEEVLHDSLIDPILFIDNIDIISISIGRDRYYPAHIIINVHEPITVIDQYVKQFNLEYQLSCSYLESKDSSFISISTRNWYRSHFPDNGKIMLWFTNIPSIIDRVINKR